MTGEIVRGRIVETEAYPRGKSKEYAVERKEFSSHELANGPSKLCMAFDITRDNCDKLDMTERDSELWLEEWNGDDESRYGNGGFEIETSKRIGISGTPLEAQDKLWRFHVKGSLCESRAKVGKKRKLLVLE
jgi:3-methyladenine DNA glycosylase Mpg